MAVDLNLITELRQRTGVSVSDCKKALDESKGSVDEALKILKKKGIEVARKKADRATSEGRIESYIHFSGKVGVLVDVGCETDFVAKNPEFVQFCKDIAMHIAAKAPVYVKEEDVPQEELALAKDKKIFLVQNCLLNQAYIKDEKMTIKDYLESIISKMGENMVINRFSYYKIK